MTWVISSYSGQRYYRNHISGSLRTQVIRRDGYHCRYCGIRVGRYRDYETERPYPKMVLDHVNPRAAGGETNLNNLVAACVHCNAKKYSRTPEQAGMALLPVPEHPLLVRMAPRKPPNAGPQTPPTKRDE